MGMQTWNSTQTLVGFYKHTHTHTQCAGYLSGFGRGGGAKTNAPLPPPPRKKPCTHTHTEQLRTSVVSIVLIVVCDVRTVATIQDDLAGRQDVFNWQRYQRSGL